MITNRAFLSTYLWQHTLIWSNFINFSSTGRNLCMAIASISCWCWVNGWRTDGRILDAHTCKKPIHFKGFPVPCCTHRNYGSSLKKKWIIVCCYFQNIHENQKIVYTRAKLVCISACSLHFLSTVKPLETEWKTKTFLLFLLLFS